MTLKKFGVNVTIYGILPLLEAKFSRLQNFFAVYINRIHGRNVIRLRLCNVYIIQVCSKGKILAIRMEFIFVIEEIIIIEYLMLYFSRFFMNNYI